MRRPSARTVKTVSITGGTGGAVTGALAAGWVCAALLIVAIVVPIFAICWVSLILTGRTGWPCSSPPGVTAQRIRRKVTHTPA